jgi:hypothetical protein
MSHVATSWQLKFLLRDLEHYEILFFFIFCSRVGLLHVSSPKKSKRSTIPRGFVTRDANSLSRTAKHRQAQQSINEQTRGLWGQLPKNLITLEKKTTFCIQTENMRANGVRFQLQLCLRLRSSPFSISGEKKSLAFSHFR